MATLLRNTEKVAVVNDDEELRKRGYVSGSTLGEGSYAKVKGAYSERLNRKVALKIINRRKAPKDFQQKFLPRELEVMKLIKHPNIIQMFEVMQFNGKVFIAMEVAGHGDLLEYIKLRGAIPEERSKLMFQQMVNAVEYLHGINVIHRDLKCENILLDTSNNLKVSDFGFARFLTDTEFSKTFCGSAAYAAPEILQGIPYKGTAYDIWSMGVILYIMACGSMPFDDSNIKKMIKYQTERRVAFSKSKKLSQEVKDLVHRMLEPNVKNRFTIKEIQHCDWLQSLHQYYRKVEAGSNQTSTPDYGAEQPKAPAPTSANHPQQQQRPVQSAAPQPARQAAPPSAAPQSVRPAEPTSAHPQSPRPTPPASAAPQSPRPAPPPSAAPLPASEKKDAAVSSKTKQGSTHKTSKHSKSVDTITMGMKSMHAQ